AKLQQTLALIKPDAMQQGHQQAIVDRIEKEGFNVVRQQQFQFTRAQAEQFYREHEHRPFYASLTEWMASAPVYAMVLEKDNAVQAWRTLMGPTDANKARDIDPTSIRALYGTDGSQNAVHGSDCVTSAERETAIVFGPVTSAEEKGASEAKAPHDAPNVTTHAPTPDAPATVPPQGAAMDDETAVTAPVHDVQETNKPMDPNDVPPSDNSAPNDPNATNAASNDDSHVLESLQVRQVNEDHVEDSPSSDHATMQLENKPETTPEPVLQAETNVSPVFFFFQ
ncbi:nucleoside diphosphate kinase, partial [Gongronella butleri]